MKDRIIFIALILVSLCGCNDKNSSKSITDFLDFIFSKSTEDCTFDVSYSSIKEAEKKLLEILKSKYGDPNGPATDHYYLYYDELVDFIIKEPKTMDYPFDSLQYNEYAKIVTSEDGNLRLYYWNNRSGGTWINWSNICQFRYNNKVYAHKGSIFDVKYGGQIKHEDESNNCAILDIKTIYDKQNSPIYLVHTYMRFSSMIGYESIEAIKIEEGKLVAAPIFHGGMDFHDISKADRQIEKCYRDVEFNILETKYFGRDDNGKQDFMLHFDKKNNILYVPIVDIEISDRYSLYRYNGDQFCFLGTDGALWLHPSIRSFEFFELFLETKDYTIRIDKMFDGSYRYASWNNRSTMDKMPSAIIYNGVYDEDTSRYHFKNQEYEYIVDSNKGLTVKHKNRTILFQKSI